jgi:ankyrin repeat protein
MTNELHYFAKHGNLKMVKKVVKDGADIEETFADGMTALMLACVLGHFKILAYLVERGANVAHIGRGE